LVVVWILDGEIMFECMTRMLLALAYPVYCMVVLYVALLSCDDHQCNWWEQMGEVLVVSKGVEIPLLSHRGWILFSCMVFVRAMAHVLFYALLLFSVLLDLYLVSCWHRGVPKVVGVVLKTLGLRYNTIIVWRFLYFRIIFKWDVTFWIWK